MSSFTVYAKEKDISNILGLLKVTLKKYPGVFTLGEGMSAVRVFAHVFALTAANEMRCVVQKRSLNAKVLTENLLFFTIALDFTN